MDPTHRHLTEGKQRRLGLYTLAAAAGIGVAAGLGNALGAGSVWSRWTGQPWLLRQVQSVLDYVQNPSTFIFHITNPIGNFIVQYGLEPLRSFFVGVPWPAMAFGLALIAFILSGLRPAIMIAVDARADRLHQRMGDRDGHLLAGTRRDRPDDGHRHPTRHLGRRERADTAARCAPFSTFSRDVAAARLHHPVHLSDAGVDRSRHHRRRALRDAGRHPARRGRHPRRLTVFRRGRRCVWRDTGCRRS